MMGDPKVAITKMPLKVGMRVRLTRNLDKDQGFVNGALGTIEKDLRRVDDTGQKIGEHAYVVKFSNDKRVLLHPIVEGRRTFLPCTYGYATTMRRAQGATLGKVVLYFNTTSKSRKAHPDEGYAYVGASRVRTAEDLYHFGLYRRTDWLPVVDTPLYAQMCTVRSDASMSADSEADAVDGAADIGDYFYDHMEGQQEMAEPEAAHHHSDDSISEFGHELQESEDGLLFDDCVSAFQQDYHCFFYSANFMYREEHIHTHIYVTIYQCTYRSMYILT
jgi:hypothetical protein